jgi:hypothetical protein
MEEETMNRRLNLLAAAVIFGGISTFAEPRPAHATYADPLKAIIGVTYCCTTGTTARCCSSTGCMTKEGVCLVAR